MLNPVNTTVVIVQFLSPKMDMKLSKIMGIKLPICQIKDTFDIESAVTGCTKSPVSFSNQRNIIREMITSIKTTGFIDT